MEQAVLEGVIAVRAALHGNSRELHRILIRADNDDRPVVQLEQRARASGVTVQRVGADEIDSVASGTTHGGVAALAGPRRFALLDELGAEATAPFLALLDGIEDPFNFGYALRSLYAAGAHGAILAPRNWMSAAGTVGRASAGASELLPLAVVEPLEAVQRCSARGLAVVCAAADRHRRRAPGNLPQRALARRRGRADPVRPRLPRLTRHDVGNRRPRVRGTAPAGSVIRSASRVRSRHRERRRQCRTRTETLAVCEFKTLTTTP